MASNVSLVESESCAPLIPLVSELMDSKVISTIIYLIIYFFKCRIIIFRSQMLQRRRSGMVPENFKPCVRQDGGQQWQRIIYAF